MICYYYYLLFDIVNSTDKKNPINNYVKESKLFEGELTFSDDFLHNFDPREDHFKEEIKEIQETYYNFKT